MALLKQKINGAWVTVPLVGGSTITIDNTLSDTSENPVQNKVIKEQIDNLNNSITTLEVNPDVINVETDTSFVVIKIMTMDKGDLHQYIAPKGITFGEWIDSPLYDTTGLSCDTNGNVVLSCDLYTNLWFGHTSSEIITEDIVEVPI